MKGIFIANKIHGVFSSLPHKFIIHTWRAQIEMDRNHKNREMKKTWKIKKCLIISVAKKIKIRKTVLSAYDLANMIVMLVNDRWNAIIKFKP